MCVVYIGKNMTSIAGQIYIMKSSGYLDNLKIMGINIASYICLPKIISSMLVYPLITILSCFFSLLGAAFYCIQGKDITFTVFVASYVSVFNFKYITLCMVKSILFGFLCGSVASYIGYSASGGKNDNLIQISQRCFTICCIVVLITDVIANLINYYLT